MPSCPPPLLPPTLMSTRRAHHISRRQTRCREREEEQQSAYAFTLTDTHTYTLHALAACHAINENEIISLF